MKKLTVLFAAIAMIAFAGCKKENTTNYVADENGMVTLRMSGETWQNSSKQTYVDFFNRVAFDMNDEVFINGVTATITPCDVNGSTTDESENDIARSFYGMMTVNGNVLTGDDYVLYPAGIFTAGTAADMSDYTCELFEERALIQPDMDVMLGEGFEWPMAAKLSGNQFLLKNAVAVVTPSIKYGPAFVNALYNMDNSFIANETYVHGTTAVPQLFVEEVQLVSTDQVLNGLGHIENIATEPTLTMEANGGNTIIIPELNINCAATTGSETLLGGLTVPPFAAGKHLQLIVKFRLEFANGGIYHCIFTGNNLELDEIPGDEGGVSILRSGNTTLCANLSTASSASKITLDYAE